MHTVENLKEELEELKLKITILEHKINFPEIDPSAVKKYIFWVPMGVVGWTSVYHNMNSMDIVVLCYDSTNNVIQAPIRMDTHNSISVYSSGNIQRVVTIG